MTCRYSIDDEVIVINCMVRFSFNKQFPKCNTWLTYSSSIAYYMTLEYNPKKGEKCSIPDIET